MTGTISFFIIGVLILGPLGCWGDTEWWKNALFFEAPLHDGYGASYSSLRDLQAHLVTIKTVGASAVSLGPIFHSDNDPYEIIDYTDVDARLGSMDDFTNLVDSAHSIGLKVILDVTPFHTSDKHQWFQAWEENKEPWNSYYYERSDSMPMSYSGKKNAWYTHLAGSHAPTLRVRDATEQLYKDIFQYWLERGVDGFRILGYLTKTEAHSSYDSMKIDRDGDFFGTIGKRVNEWTIKSNVESKYLAMEILGLWKDTANYKINDQPPHTMQLKNPLYEISNENVHGDTSLRSYILRRLKTIPTDASVGWMLSERYGRDLRWSVGWRNVHAIRMFLMLLPGHGYIHAVDELNIGDSNDNYQPIGRDHTSCICRFKRITELRKLPAFEHGECDRQTLNNDSVLVMRREVYYEPVVYVAVINLEDHRQTINLTRLYPELEEELDVVVNTDPKATTIGRIERRDWVFLPPNSGIVLRSNSRERTTGCGGRIEWPILLEFCNEPNERDCIA